MKNKIAFLVTHLTDRLGLVNFTGEFDQNIKKYFFTEILLRILQDLQTQSVDIS